MVLVDMIQILAQLFYLKVSLGLSPLCLCYLLVLFYQALASLSIASLYRVIPPLEILNIVIFDLLALAA